MFRDVLEGDGDQCFGNDYQVCTVSRGDGRLRGR